MNSKKKMVIAISSFAIVLLAAVVAVVAVLAAQSVTVKNSVSISYNATDVYGYAQTSYKYAGDASYTTWMSETDLSGTITDQSEDFTLTSTKQYVIIKFEFKKESAVHDNFKATLTYTPDPSSDYITVTSGTAEDSITTAAATTMFNAVSINQDSSYQAFYVKIALNSTEHDVTFGADFAWTLAN